MGLGVERGKKLVGELDSWVSGSFIDVAGIGILVKLYHTDDVPLFDTL